MTQRRKRKAQFKDRVVESELCVICGKNRATTGEHIPPRALFLAGLEPHLVVPACDECNHSTKKDDEFLRQVVSAGSHTPEALRLWKQKVASKFPAFPKTQAGLRRQLRKVIADVPSLGKSPITVLLAESKRINAVLRKMVFGLYWFHTGSILPASTPIEFQGLNLLQTAKFVANPQLMAVFEKAAMGIYRDPTVVRTFFYRVGIAGRLSIWYFVFFGNNIFIAVTGDLAAEARRIGRGEK